MKWVDCYIDKFIFLYPFVRTYVAMINRWYINPKIEGGNLTIEFSQSKKSEEDILNLYGIHRVSNNTWIDEYLEKGKKVILPCDGFYLPYAQEYYNIVHILHYVLVLKKDNQNYYTVYDDKPLYNGKVSYDCLYKSYSVFKEYEDFHYHEITNKKNIKKQQELEFLKTNLKSSTLNFREFLQSLIQCNLEPLKKLEIIKELSLYTARINALERIVDDVNMEINEKDIDDIKKVFRKYSDEWTLIGFLSNKGLIANNASVWERVEKRIYNLMKLEEDSCNAINTLKKLL